MMNLKEECGAIKIWGMVFDILFVMSQREELRKNKTKQLYISKIVEGMCIYVGVWDGEGRREYWEEIGEKEKFRKYFF